VKPRVFLLPIASAMAALIFATAAVKADEPPPPQVVEVDATVQGLTAVDWQHVAERYLHATRNLQGILLHRPQVGEAIKLACTVYGSCSTLWRKARCESHLYRYAQNRGSHASGLFQFLPSTWRSTPYARFSVFSPYANALAAGWMHQHGRGGEWVCQ
jgi:hypothetical protein